jgi:hypothetical protein
MMQERANKNDGLVFDWIDHSYNKIFGNNAHNNEFISYPDIRRRAGTLLRLQRQDTKKILILMQQRGLLRMKNRGVILTKEDGL